MQRVLHPSIHDEAFLFNPIGPKVVGPVLTIHPDRPQGRERASAASGEGEAPTKQVACRLLSRRRLGDPARVSSSP